jgi:prepilin-type N-terminal cleavage/methylation domain-containing protein
MMHFRKHLESRLKQGFTLVEMLLALLLTGILSVMLFSSFSTVTRSWTVGREVADSSGHSDFIMDQIESALRSAYTPGEGDAYGLKFESDGDDEKARDRIEWTKIGPALIGDDVAFANVPHRVHIFIADEENGRPGGFAVCAWRQSMRIDEETGAKIDEGETKEVKDEFRPEEEEAFLILSPKVQGMNIRLLDPEQPIDEEKALKWLEETEEWTKENILPSAIEVTLWLEPPEPGADPIEYKRIIQIPMAQVSQNSSLASGANQASRGGTSATEGGGGRRPNNNIGISTGNNNGGRPGGGGGRPNRPAGGGSPFVPGGNAGPPAPPMP